MKIQKIRAASQLRAFSLLASLIVLPVFTATVSAQQFFAEQQIDGEIRVTDDIGAEVSVVNGDPIGTRPSLCPYDSYYFNEMDTDRALLVLSECIGEGSFPVELLVSAE